MIESTAVPPEKNLPCVCDLAASALRRSGGGAVVAVQKARDVSDNQYRCLQTHRLTRQRCCR